MITQESQNFVRILFCVAERVPVYRIHLRLNSVECLMNIVRVSVLCFPHFLVIATRNWWSLLIPKKSGSVKQEVAFYSQPTYTYNKRGEILNFVFCLLLKDFYFWIVLKIFSQSTTLCISCMVDCFQSICYTFSWKPFWFGVLVRKSNSVPSLSILEFCSLVSHFVWTVTLAQKWNMGLRVSYGNIMLLDLNRILTNCQESCKQFGRWFQVFTI